MSGQTFRIVLKWVERSSTHLVTLLYLLIYSLTNGVRMTTRMLRRDFGMSTYTRDIHVFAFYVRMYVCMYTYTYINIGMRVHIYIYIYIYMYYLSLSLHVYVYVYVYVYIHIYIYVER